MTVTAGTIARHELAGLPTRVANAPNAELVGVTGRTIRETTNTLLVRSGDAPLGDPDARTRRVPKRGTTFAFELPDEGTVRVRGDRLVARPARRTATGGVSPWV